MNDAIKAGIYNRQAVEGSATVVRQSPKTERIIIGERSLDMPRSEYITYLENKILELGQRADTQDRVIARLGQDMKRVQAAIRKLDSSLNEKVDKH